MLQAFVDDLAFIAADEVQGEVALVVRAELALHRLGHQPPRALVVHQLTPRMFSASWVRARSNRFVTSLASMSSAPAMRSGFQRNSSFRTTTSRSSIGSARSERFAHSTASPSAGGASPSGAAGVGRMSAATRRAIEKIQTSTAVVAVVALDRASRADEGVLHAFLCLALVAEHPGQEREDGGCV